MDMRVASRRNSSENRCIVYKKTEPKTFSNFVDKVINEFPCTVASRSVPTFPRNPNNPYDVLRNKGLLDISRDSARVRDGSNVTLNFYTEESRDGETFRSFSSNHHFKDGRLIYSSTQELLPRKQPDLEYKVMEEIKARRAISSGRGDLRTKSDITCKESVRKKLTDLLNDIQKQKVIHYYEKEAKKRHRCYPPYYAVDVCDRRNTNKEAYLRSLHSENKQEPPKSMKYLVTYKQTPNVRQTNKLKVVRSSSEISISSRESSTYSSPDRTVKEFSKRHEKYRTVIHSPKPKIRKDLFVIPKHTCRNIPELSKYKTFKASHQWDSVRDFVEQPKLSICRKIKDFSIDSDSNGGEKKYRYKHIKSVRYDSDDERSGKPRRSSHSKEELQDHFNLLKGFTQRKVYPGANVIEDVTNRDIRHSIRQKGNKDYPSHGREHIGNWRNKRSKEKYSATKPGKFKHGIRDELPAGEPFINSAAEEEETFATATEGDSSDSSTQTLPFPSTSDSESQRGYKRNTYKHHQTSSKREQRTQKVSGDRDKVYEPSSNQKYTNKRRHINPNKIVHFEDTGKRLSQYFTTGKATLDSDKAFEDEQKTYPQKITFYRSSPKRSVYREFRKGDQQHNKLIYREESLEDYVKQRMLEDHEKHLNVMQNTVNKEALTEYREKYSTSSVKDGTSTEGSEGKEYHQYKVTVSRSETHIPEVCEACEIESLD